MEIKDDDLAKVLGLLDAAAAWMEKLARDGNGTHPGNRGVADYHVELYDFLFNTWHASAPERAVDIRELRCSIREQVKASLTPVQRTMLENVVGESSESWK